MENSHYPKGNINSTQFIHNWSLVWHENDFAPYVTTTHYPTRKLIMLLFLLLILVGVGVMVTGWVGVWWVAGLTENKANSANLAEMDLGQGLP